VPNLVFKAFSRHLLQHPWQLALALLGITAGVAVIVAIRLTQHSAIDAFDAATRTTTGPATHRLVGSPGVVAHDEIRLLDARFPGLRRTPVIRATLKLPEHGDRRITLLGIDPISRADLVGRGRRREVVLFEPATLMAEPGAAVISIETARELGLERGSALPVAADGAPSRLEIIALVPGPRAAGGLVGNLVIVDIASAQETLGIVDRVSYLDVAIDDQATLEALRAWLPANLELNDLAEAARDVKRMTDAFYTNLTALSLMALLVGMFLIYNTETFLVLQRREIFGRLRALGVSRAQLLAAALAEAAAIGAAGSICGIVLGVLLADGLLAVVSTTINDLYFEASIETLSLTPATLVASFLIGVGATLFAAYWPVWQATRIEPNLVMTRTTMRTREIRELCLITASVFVGCHLLAVVALAGTATTSGGFAGICLVVVGFAALCPVTIIALGALARRAFGVRYLPERLGLRTVAASLNRTGTATAALMIATAASIGIGIMVSSFRISVADWLDSALRADLYIADASFDNIARTDKIPLQLAERIAALPSVDAVSTVLRREIRGGNGRLRLSAFRLTEAARAGFRFRDGAPAAIWSAWDSADIALVTEPYAYHHGIAVGDELTLHTDTGPRAFRVAGIYLDYASERGSVSLSRATYDRYWKSSGADGIGVYRAPAASPETVRAEVSALLGPDTSLVVNSPAELKQVSLTVFDRTFLITELLRGIAVAVSFIGILGALLAQQLERTREYGVLRAIGFNYAEMCRNVLTQTLLLGVSAALLAVPVGILIGVILIEVINPRSFGWTMTMLIEPGLIVKACAVALAAALAAGLYPSWHAARIEPADAMRYE
jgi:putative ABC transport system permease protein